MTKDHLLHQGDVTYQFDDDGYLAQRDSDTFQYSARGELLQATVGGQTITYEYDGLSRRVSRTDASGTYQYLYGNPGNPFQITHMRDPGGTLATYYYDRAGLLFSLDRGGVRYYVATDQVGTPRVVSDAAGNTVKIVRYDSFGNLGSDSNPGFDLPIGFAGGLADTITGLVRFGFRDYDPVVGRWTARDPILFAGGDANLFRYVLNNPVSLVDPGGVAWYDHFGWLEPISNLAAGFGDEYTHIPLTHSSITELARKGISYLFWDEYMDDIVDPCSKQYTLGHKLAVATDLIERADSIVNLWRPLYESAVIVKVPELAIRFPLTTRLLNNWGVSGL